MPALAAARGTAVLAVLAGSLHAAWLAAARLPARPRGLLEALLACVGASLGLALLAAPLAVLVAFVPRLGPARQLAMLAAIVALEVGASWTLLGWARSHDIELTLRRAGVTTLVTTLVGALVAALAARVASRLSRRTGPRALTFVRAVAWLAPLALWLCLPASLRAHDGAGVLLAVALLVPLAPAVDRRVRGTWRIVVPGLGLLALLWTLFAARRDEASAGALLTHHEPSRVWTALVGPLGDLDGDGASMLFGGRDCAPFDRFVGPHSPEVAGNGVDDNCLLGDLADDALPPLPPPGPAWLPGADILLLCVDALRPDRTSLHGYARDTTPNLARHFAGAFRFTAAHAEADATRETLPSLLSGRRLFDLRWHRDDAVVLDPAARFLGDHLARAGYQSFAALPFTALNMLGTPQLGFTDLHVYADIDGRGSTAAEVTDALLAAHARLAGPRLLFAHYYEPHEPHVQQRPFRGVSPDLYDQEVARVDAEIGRLLDTLERSGALANTIVILTSDHGEAFGEHGHSFHDVHVFQEDLHVPLLVRVPGRPGHAIDAPVSVTQLAATLLELVGAPALPGGPTRASLVPLLRGEVMPPQRITGSARALRAAGRWMIREGDTKVIVDADAGTVTTFDLAADPGERAGHSTAAGTALADDLLEHELGAARSRALRAMQIGAARADEALVQLAPGVALVTTRAELTGSPATYPTLPIRVLVRVALDLTAGRPDSLDYTVELRRGAAVVASVSEPIAGGRTSLHAWPDGARIEDVRTFKVRPKDGDAEVFVRFGEFEAGLGRVDTLPVAPR